MKIRTKLSLLFTALTGTILFIFALIIYYSAYKNREIEFYKSLKKEALTKANLFFNAKVDAKTLQTIYQSNREILNEVEGAIYDTTFTLLYHDAEHLDFVKETQQMIDDIKSNHHIQFYQKEWQVVGLEYKYEKRNYVVIAAAYDQYGYRKLKSLGKTIIIVFVFSILFIYFAGRLFSKRAFIPIMEMNIKAKNISASNLDSRLNDSGKDELAELANTFNKMLDRLEESFDAQKAFVSNISHELRTPLSAIITELQLSSNKERSIDEYKKVITNALSDSRKLVKLSNSLLDFAKASYDTSGITFREVRLDEILIDAQQQVIKSDETYRVSISYENEIEDETLIKGNEYLLKTAFVNLMENACKFSNDKHSIITIASINKQVVLKFEDKGIGISDAEIHTIFIPFFRGENKTNVDGNGIGLSLTKKIIELHGGLINVTSKINVGTSFTITLPNYKL